MTLYFPDDRLLENRRSIDQPTRDWGISVDSAVAQERPVAADIFQCFQVDFAHEDLFFVMRSFGDYLTERVTQE